MSNQGVNMDAQAYLHAETPIRVSVAHHITIGALGSGRITLMPMDTGALDRLIEAAVEAKRRMLTPAREDAA